MHLSSPVVIPLHESSIITLGNSFHWMAFSSLSFGGVLRRSVAFKMLFALFVRIIRVLTAWVAWPPSFSVHPFGSLVRLLDGVGVVKVLQLA
ncbi:hypothetical protein C1H46_036235 [Malus baccata]|uniref:Uncharacterized protein n=1 Tax=Malus baccata TaxID=106549 RepID=A0A540KVR0_MALBA|nr:hypothetical protein C1H46_036235 [Malus baccata]